MRSLETDHVISGPMRCFKKRMENRHQTDRQTHRHVDSMTDPAQKSESVKIYVIYNKTLMSS